MNYTTERNAKGGVRFTVSNPPEVGAKLVKTCGSVVTFQGIGPAGMLLCTDCTGGEHLLFPQQIVGPFVAAQGVHDADLTRDEWVRRFADRIKQVAEWNESDAMSAALAAADSHERNEREAGNTVDWMDPEEEADVEMSYWDDDEATDS